MKTVQDLTIQGEEASIFLENIRILLCHNMSYPTKIKSPMWGPFFCNISNSVNLKHNDDDKEHTISLDHSFNTPAYLCRVR
jgi:hypothetical protein